MLAFLMPDFRRDVSVIDREYSTKKTMMMPIVSTLVFEARIFVFQNFSHRRYIISNVERRFVPKTSSNFDIRLGS